MTEKNITQQKFWWKKNKGLRGSVIAKQYEENYQEYFRER